MLEFVYFVTYCNYLLTVVFIWNFLTDLQKFAAFALDDEEQYLTLGALKMHKVQNKCQPNIPTYDKVVCVGANVYICFHVKLIKMLLEVIYI